MYLPDVLRTGMPAADRGRTATGSAIERLTVQDVAVFFQEVLAALPQLVVDLLPTAPGSSTSTAAAAAG